MASTIPRTLACLALSFGSLSASAESAPASIEDLLGTEIEGASRFAQPLSEAPAAVSVVSADDIRQYGFRTLGEALSSMRGVYTTNERDYTYVGIRGFARPGDYNTRMLLMTDGIRRNDPLYDTANIGNEAPVEIEWVKRLEFVPGSASALYGANAIFGVANAVLWSGADLDGTRVRADVGSDRMARLSVLSGRRTDGGSDWMVGLSTYGRRGGDLYLGQFDDPSTNNGVAQGLDGERYVKMIGKLSIGDWQFDAGHTFRRKNVPTAYYGTVFNLPGDFVTDRYSYADASYAKSFADDWNVNLRLRWAEYDFVGQYVFPDLNRDTARSSWYGFDYLLGYAGFKDHKLLIGGEAQDDRRLEQANFDLSPRVVNLDDHRRQTRSGVFVQDEWRFAPAWIANFGARADRIGEFTTASPRAALIHRLTPAATLKLIYGRAFRPPNVYERFYTDGSTQEANPDLKPERITTGELVADYAVTPVLRLSANYYRYRIDDLIDEMQDPANPGMQIFVNRPPIHAHGLELETEAALRDGFHLKASVARQRVEQPFGPVVNSPKWLGKLLFDGALGATGWTLGLNLQAVDRRTSVSGAEVPGSGVGNLVLTRKGTPAVGTWAIGIYNVAGRRYLDPASAAVTGGTVPEYGRQLRLSWELAR